MRVQLSVASGWRRRGVGGAMAGVLLTAILAVAPAGASSDETVVTNPVTGEDARIVRSPWGVPHVYAESTEAASFGLGYAAAQDRLWIMDVLRRVLTGRFSELLGPVVTPAERAFVQSSYTTAERRRMYERLPERVQAEMSAYVTGVNRYIDEAQLDPRKLPIEYVQFGALPIAPLTVEEVMSFYQLLNSSAPGGVPIWGNFNLLRRLESAYGASEAQAKFDDLIRSVDADAPTTIPRDYDYRSVPTGARLGDLAPLRRHVDDARLTLAVGAPEIAAGEPLPAGTARRALPVPQNASADAALLAGERNDALRLERLGNIMGSNAQVVGPRLSATGNALLTAGPQTDYNVPAPYWEAGVHVPGEWETVGMTIPPLNYFAVGRGPGYTWTFTNGQQGDMADVYVEQLAEGDNRSYVFADVVEPMECRDHVYTFHGVAFETQEVCRTRHGPVISFDSANGLAYSERHAWWGREDLTVQSLRGLNTAGSLADFATSALTMPTSYNIFYADDTGATAWWLTGLYPRRPVGADVRLPRDGTGGAEWTGVLPVQHQPHAINLDRGWIVNWNNYPADGWQSGRVPHYASRVEKLQRAFAAPPQADPLGGTVNANGAWDADDMAANLRLGAYADDGWAFLDLLPTADQLPSQLARGALELVRTWDGVAYDSDNDGFHDSPAVTIIRRWQSVARADIFGDDLPAADVAFAEDYGELRRILSPNPQAPISFDWLDGQDRATVAAATFSKAVDAVAASFESEDMSTWLTGAGQTRYAHLNGQLAGDAADNAMCDAFGAECQRLPRSPAPGVRLPGYVPPHQTMNRGVYNHVVAFLDLPGERGASTVSACSVVTPGNSGLINALGQESPHFADQLGLYTTWQFHHQSLTDDEVTAALVGGTCAPADDGG